MHFVDETTIQVRAGNGGNGVIAFRRERNLPFGGPTGGNGGDGGSVTIHACRNVDTLLPLAREQTYAAQNGNAGSGNNRFGLNGEDILIRVPVGTILWEDGREEPLADFTCDGQEFLAARGGKGGRGNATFATAENQAPRERTFGEEGEGRKLRLEVKLIADVGLVGFPNAGKSTLLSVLSAARPKVADYPFTTMQPYPGIVSDGYGRELVMADIPGLIEGASDGAGMGTEFLRHIERCGVLLHLVNLCPIDGTYPLDNYHAINKELEKFSPALANKPQLVVGNKLDLTASDDALEWLRDELPVPVLGISAVSGEGLKELRHALFKQITNII